jgi:DNA-binding NarL/FixJ family response regulator
MLSNAKIKVLIAHADPLIAAGLESALGRMREFEIIGRDARQQIADVAIADYESGLRLMSGRSAGGGCPVMILSCSDSEAKICHALQTGARGYLLYGCSLQDVACGLHSIALGEIALGPLVARRVTEKLRQQPLTRREVDILRHMIQGMSNKAIASVLSLALGTVKTHVKSILEKLQVNSRTQAVWVAQRRGMLSEAEDGGSSSSSRLSHLDVFARRERHPGTNGHVIDRAMADSRAV